MMKKLLLLLIFLMIATSCQQSDRTADTDVDTPATFTLVGTVIDALDTDADDDGSTDTDAGALSIRVEEYSSEDNGCTAEEGDAEVVLLASDDADNDEELEGDRVRVEGEVRSSDPCVLYATSVERDEASPQPTVTTTATETATETAEPTPTETEIEEEATASPSP